MIGEGAKDAVPVLIQALQDEDSGVRQSVAWALGQIGKDAVPALILLLKDKNGDVRQNTAKALGEIGTSEALKAVEEYQ